jgi:tetratricopeptide (TPR) repeat protein
MRARRLGVCAGLLCLACPGLCAAEPPRPESSPSPAVRLWEKGQQALRDGAIDDAVRCFEQSLALDPKLTCNHLSLAAACLDRGDDAGAAPHLAAYVEAEPNRPVVRAHYAELLARLRQFDAARREFERFDAAAQEDDQLARQHLVHCHSRLMEIAEAQDDDYAAHLHHGIGLYLLACQRAPLPDEGDEELSPESLLCKAAAELVEAWRLRPGEARPCWYLFAVWSRLAQSQPAGRWLRAAEDAAPLSYLTPAERRGLRLACQGRRY